MVDLTIGRYRLERRIGAGSFATVWLGHDDALDVPVAVKVLADNWATNPDVRSRFLAEARILRRIHDRRLVQVYDIGTLDDGRPYFVMDYIDGGSLNEVKKAGVEPVRALRLAAEACRAIEVLHENGVIHRDVTPGNLLLSNSPTGQTDLGVTVLIADLGVAKSMVDAGATMTAGTPSYMAPEQASGLTPLDRRADVFSLAAVTYALLTGAPPFPVKSVADILARPPTATPPPIADRVGAPAALDAVLISGLAWEPVRRPPTAALLADALDTLARQVAASPATSQPRRPVPPHPTRQDAIGTATVATPNPRSPRTWPPGASGLPPAGQRSEVPPAVTPGTVPPAAPATEPVRPLTPVSAPSSQPSPYAGPPDGGSVTAVPVPMTVERPGEPTPVATRRPATYYVLLALAACALFAVSMFITVLLLR